MLVKKTIYVCNKCGHSVESPNKYHFGGTIPYYDYQPCPVCRDGYQGEPQWNSDSSKN